MPSMSRELYESGIYLLEKQYSHGYRVKYVGYYQNRSPIFQVQRKVFGLFYRPCKRKNGTDANFFTQERCLEFITKDYKNRNKSRN